MSNAQVFSNPPKYGTATLVAGSKIVLDSAVTADSNILLTLKTVNAGLGPVSVTAVVPGTSFTITSTSATNTCAYNYVIFN
jgi:hypothetical protein